MRAAVEAGAAGKQAIAVSHLTNILVGAAYSSDGAGAAVVPQIHVVLGIESDYPLAGGAGGGLDADTFVERLCQQTGLLGMAPDDYQIANSFKIAQEQGMEIEFGEIELEDAHPNTAVLRLKGITSSEIEVQASSIGGGRINIDKIDGINTNFSGDNPTLIVHNLDQPGHVAEVTSMLAHKSVNIATMQLFRSDKGQNAVMVLECDQPIPEDGISWLAHVEGVLRVTYFPGC